MSTKTTFKRVALVTVAALGFGLLGATAGNAANPDTSIAKASANTDLSLFLKTAGGSAGARTTSVYTANSTLALSNLTFTTSAAATSATGVTVAAGTTTTLGATAATSFLKDAAVTARTAKAFSTLTATSAMRLKVVFVDICFLSISRRSDDPSAGFG